MVRDKLTLSIEREVVKEAKQQRLNISFITEVFLRAYTLVGRTNCSLHYAYQELFLSIIPLLKKFDCHIKIAEGEDIDPTEDDKGKEYENYIPITIFLESDGSFYIDEKDHHFKDIKKIPPKDFLEPGIILSNLANTLGRSKEARKERINEIRLVKSIVDGISKHLLEKDSTIRNKKGAQELKISTETATQKYRRKKYRRVPPEKRDRKRKKRIDWG